MFRIAEDPSSGSLVQCLAKNYKNDSIVSVDMDRVGVMAAYSYTVNYTHTHTHTHTTVSICCHNTDPVHVNGHDRIILVILTKHCTKLPDDGSSVIRNMSEHF